MLSIGASCSPTALPRANKLTFLSAGSATYEVDAVHVGWSGGEEFMKLLRTFFDSPVALVVAVLLGWGLSEYAMIMTGKVLHAALQ